MARPHPQLRSGAPKDAAITLNVFEEAFSATGGPLGLSLYPNDELWMAGWFLAIQIADLFPIVPRHAVERASRYHRLFGRLPVTAKEQRGLSF